MPRSAKLTTLETRATAGLAALYSLRLLGLFLLMPVWSVYAREIPGGEDPRLMGLALGAYGLTQALLQLPLGMLSDRIGRKRVIYAGLAVFIVGAVVAALASNVVGVILGRALQGAGAISAAITALLADLTREEHRTRAMAVIGMSIGLTFAGSLVAGPLLHHWIGVPGIFWLTAGLGVLALIGVASVIPDPGISRFHPETEANRRWLRDVLHHPQLARLNWGVFALHAAQMSLFVGIPTALTQAGLAVEHHWTIYLPVVLIAFLLMAPAIIVAETRNQLKPVFLAAIALMALAQWGFTFEHSTLTALTLGLGVYFVAFNILEASQPSLVSKLAPAAAKGTAMGVYATLQSLGAFVGGAAGGWLLHHGGLTPLFAFSASLVVLWFFSALGMKPPLPVKSAIYHIGETWEGDAAALSARLAMLPGVIEAVVMKEERVALLKVMREGWDEAAVKQIISETN